MSQFDEYSADKYAEKLRSFINNKQEFPIEYTGLKDENNEEQSGVVAKNSAETVANLEKLANEKAKRAEANDSTLNERLQIAKDYKSFSDADIARLMGVSHDVVVRLWEEDVQVLGDITTLARVLDVPAIWLECGGQMHLPANSHIGVRVGQECFMYREFMYAKTIELVSSLPENSELDYAQAFIENQLRTNQSLSKIARRAGGRWQVMSGTLVFAPWISIEEPHHLACKLWPDEVEAMIAEELTTKTTVYGAWSSLKARCEAMGISKDQFPNIISLHKRLERKRNHSENINEITSSGNRKSDRNCIKMH